MLNDVEPLVLETGHSRCEIYPALGGSIGCWRVAGQEIFRATTPETVVRGDLLGMASFPLVPYSNRIGNARFVWAGEAMSLRPNFAPEPHAIHGVGWRRPWEVSARSSDSATLVLAHGSDDDWPWPFHAEQEFVLTDDCLTLILRAANMAEIAAPLAFGHHPYFDTAGASLAFAAEAVWMSGSDGLPTEPVAPSGDFDFGTLSPVAGRTIDHCYAGVSGPALINWSGRPRQLEITTSPQLPAAVVYVPESGSGFCFEPVPHMNNALNQPGRGPEMPVLAPGASSETTISFRTFAQ